MTTVAAPIKVQIPTTMPMAVAEVTPILDSFAAEFLREHPDLSSGEAGRQAYHAAVRAGIGNFFAGYVEFSVSLERKREQQAAQAEERHRHADWLADAQAGAVR